MKCPNCDQLLLITERQNVEIDYCPSCRGVWLDRGELDKIIQYSYQQEQPASIKQTSFSNASEKADSTDFDKRYKYESHQKGYSKHNKRKSFLGDLFDFD